MTPDTIADAEKSRSLRERMLKTLPDQTALDSFCLDYFPDTKKNRFSVASNREDQINKLIEIEGFQAVQTVFAHYLRRSRVSSNKTHQTCRIALAAFFAGLLPSVFIISATIYVFLPDYQALQRESEFQSSCNKGNHVSCQRLLEHHKRRCGDQKWDDCLRLGDYYWLQQDLNLSYNYYKIACEHEQSLGCYYMAMLSEQGDSVPKNENIAKEIYEQLCKKKMDKACVRLGNMYQTGRAVSVDAARARDLFHAACEQQNPVGCYKLAQMYEIGTSKVGQDLTIAYENYEKACNGYGDFRSCLKLGLLYYKHRIHDSSNTAAQRMFEKSCAQGAGELDACVNLGRIYEDGANGINDLPRAIAEYGRACSRNHHGGCINLALIYSRKDTPYYHPEQALAILRRSCLDGVELGCYNYGLSIFNSISTSQIVMSEAASMLGNSCRRGGGDSCYLLGQIATKGQIDRGPAQAILKDVCVDSMQQLGCEWIAPLQAAQDALLSNRAQ